METIKRLIIKYQELINYAFWGCFSMVANVLSYHICYNVCGLSNLISTIIAWAVAVLVAFVTNKLYVFKSRNTSPAETWKEFLSFTGFRLLSEVFDIIIMVWAVDMMGWNALFWKIVANVIVIALNYVFSKFIIFKKNPQSPQITAESH